MLKLNWNGKECDGWVWDGKELKPKFGSSNAAWIWDGKEFKPKYGSSNAAWIFDGKELKPKYGSSNNAWMISGGKAKPKYGNSNNAFERTIAKGLNFLGTYSLGLIPSEEDNGGLLANIGVIATGDPKFKILGNPKSKRLLLMEF